MNKWLVQLVLVISSVILLSGCNSGGSEDAVVEVDTFFDPLPIGLPVFKEISTPYFNASAENNGALALYSYKPQEMASTSFTQTEILSSDSDVIITLNTQVDKVGRDEFTVLARNDSVYLVNHLTYEIRLLNHFTNKVCELIPSETVKESVGDQSERVLTVLHEELVYVVTADSSVTNNDCTSDSKKRFYVLPLDYQLDASLAENGIIETIDLASEALARSQLIFGWVADKNAVGKDIMEYAYLGFDSELQRLALFDENKNVIWSQARTLQKFDAVSLGSEMMSSQYLFHVQELENQQYLIQLGLDVFVVDSGLDLLSKRPIQIENILVDKVLTVSVDKIESESEALAKTYVLPVETVFDHDNLILIDDSKLYKLAYQANIPVRNPSKLTRIVKQNPTSIDAKEFLSKHAFSQFDLKICESTDAACLAAQEIDAQTWQFFTLCEELYGCETPVVTANFCQTLAEFQQSQSTEEICSVSDYRHIAEMNNTANDAQLLAYMQYVDNYVQSLEFTLKADRLFVVARMDHKDVLLSYNFNVDFSAAKSLREQVLIGKQADLTGIDAYFINNNLFFTALEKGSIRSNECYKNAQKVPCDLSDLSVGTAIVCTGLDLSEGLCVNQFREYESKAFFCSEDQLIDLTCSAVNSVEGDDEDAKWLKLYDYRDSSEKMYLLTGDHSLALDTGNLDEGKLYNPFLYEVDQLSGQKNSDFLTEIDGSVELVSNGWLSKDPEQGVPEVFGYINVIAEEIQQTAGYKTTVQSSLVTYLLEQTFENSSSLTPNFIKAPKVAERDF